MKKIAFLNIVFTTIVSTSLAQKFSDLTFKDAQGETISLGNYSGKKIMFYILPLNASDPAYGDLLAFKSRYLDTVAIIGILSIEDGFQNSVGDEIRSLYSNMNIVMTEGCYTKKSSGGNQAVIMKWLTDKNYNRYFDMDAKGTGHKFFVNESGRLYGVLPPGSSLISTFIDKIVHSGN